MELHLLKILSPKLQNKFYLQKNNIAGFLINLYCSKTLLDSL